MSDLFHEKMREDWLDRVFDVMIRANWHQYQVLTKRADRMREYMQKYADSTGQIFPGLEHIWLGVSTENQETADKRIPDLIETPASIRFLSVEPMVGPVDLAPYLPSRKVHWVIVGAESGPGARPMEEDWARIIRDQCQMFDVRYFLKQLIRKKNGRSRKVETPAIDGRRWVQYPRRLRTDRPRKPIDVWGDLANSVPFTNEETAHISQ